MKMVSVFSRVRRWGDGWRFGRQSRREWARDCTALMGERVCFSCRHCGAGVGRSVRNCTIDGGPCLPADEVCEHFKRRFS